MVDDIYTIFATSFTSSLLKTIGSTIEIIRRKIFLKMKTLYCFSPIPLLRIPSYFKAVIVDSESTARSTCAAPDAGIHVLE